MGRIYVVFNNVNSKTDCNSCFTDCDIGCDAASGHYDDSCTADCDSSCRDS